MTGTVKRAWRWIYPVLIVGLILGGGAVLYIRSVENTAEIARQHADDLAQDQQIDSLTTSLAQANAKLAKAGLPTVPVIIQPKSGQNGRDGRDGRSILAVTCTTGGVWQVTYDDGTTASAGGGCIGKTGATGEQGAPGTDGVNGTDGADGAPGATGATGPAGPAGADGKNGADGQPPTSWTYADELGTTYTCTRDDPFDASAPKYTCAPSAPNQGARQ